MFRRGLSFIVAATMGLGAWAATAEPVPYPSKPVRIVVPFPPGGPVDVMARVLGEHMSKSMDATVIVENRPGAGGNIGSVAVAKSQADGYTLMLATGSILTINEALYARPGFDAAKDFAPVSLVGDMPLVMTVNPEVPAKSIAELVAWAKERKEPVVLSSAGNGTTPHLAAELFQREAGVPVLHVPYRGGADSAMAIIGKQVDGGIETPPSVLPHVQSGRLKALAVAGPERLSALPDVPTTTEAGLPGLQIVSWFGLVAPADTPQGIVEKLNAEVAQALASSEVQERFAKLAIRPVSSTPTEMARLSESDRAKWGKLVKDAGIRLE